MCIEFCQFKPFFLNLSFSFFFKKSPKFFFYRLEDQTNMDIENQNVSNTDSKNEGKRQTNESESQNDELEFYGQILKQTDAIMEDDVLKNLKNFLVKGGKPQEVIKYLSEGYRGYAQMCNLICQWLRLLGMSDEEIVDIVESYMHQLIVENFDEKKADEIFNVETVVCIIFFF